jgi:hypothetical protein
MFDHFLSFFLIFWNERLVLENLFSLSIKHKSNICCRVSFCVWMSHCNKQLCHYCFPLSRICCLILLLCFLLLDIIVHLQSFLNVDVCNYITPNQHKVIFYNVHISNFSQSVTEWLRFLFNSNNLDFCRLITLGGHKSLDLLSMEARCNNDLLYFIAQ